MIDANQKRSSQTWENWDKGLKKSVSGGGCPWQFAELILREPQHQYARGVRLLPQLDTQFQDMTAMLMDLFFDHALKDGEEILIHIEFSKAVFWNKEWPDRQLEICFFPRARKKQRGKTQSFHV